MLCRQCTFHLSFNRQSISVKFWRIHSLAWGEEYLEISNTFTFPHAIGLLILNNSPEKDRRNLTLCHIFFIASVDSTFIRIRQPLHQCYAYTNRKKFCSMTLQAACKPNREFVDCSTGYPSSMHDASVFAQSNLGRNIGRLLHGTSYHLIADSAYGLTTTLMKPYQDNGRLDEVHENIFSWEFDINFDLLFVIFCFLYL